MATKREQKPSKKPQQAEKPQEAEEREEAAEEREDEEEDEAPAASAKPASAQERRARMRARRAAPVAEEPAAREEAHDDHDDHGHGGDDHGHGHDDAEEEEIDTSNDPTWWVPHAVLAVLVLVGIFGFFGAFNSLAQKLGYKGVPGLVAATEQSKPEEKPASPTPPPRPNPMQMGDQGNKEMFGAKHLLVMYKGSMRAPESVTRTKDEAKARAEEALKKARGGAKFEDLVREYSDEPGAGARGGDLGKFPKGRMVPAFQDGLEKTKVGAVSDLVETPFGYHVLLRTQ